MWTRAGHGGHHRTANAPGHQARQRAHTPHPAKSGDARTEAGQTGRPGTARATRGTRHANEGVAHGRSAQRRRSAERRGPTRRRGRAPGTPRRARPPVRPGLRRGLRRGRGVPPPGQRPAPGRRPAPADRPALLPGRPLAARPGARRPERDGGHRGQAGAARRVPRADRTPPAPTRVGRCHGAPGRTHRAPPTGPDRDRRDLRPARRTAAAAARGTAAADARRRLAGAGRLRRRAPDPAPAARRGAHQGSRTG